MVFAYQNHRCEFCLEHDKALGPDASQISEALNIDYYEYIAIIMKYGAFRSKYTDCYCFKTREEVRQVVDHLNAIEMANLLAGQIK